MYTFLNLMSSRVICTIANSGQFSENEKHLSLILILIIQNCLIKSRVIFRERSDDVMHDFGHSFLLGTHLELDELFARRQEIFEILDIC